ncbi:MAG: Hsp70 family protein, partial [Ostreibacterium sp.]
MSLLQIAEPGQTTKPHQSKKVIGIDLGTTNSLVAATRHGRVEVLEDVNGQAILPSVIAINANGEKLLGYEALSADNGYTKILSVKRVLGYSAGELAKQGLNHQYDWVETASIPAIKTPAGLINPIEVSAEILKSLRQRAEEAFGQVVDGAVIS